MKFKFISTFVALLFISSLYSQDWTPVLISQNPPSISMDYQHSICVDILDENNAWIGASEGLILHTNDGGDTWNELNWFHDAWKYEIRDVQFINTNLGFFTYTSAEGWTGQSHPDRIARIYRTENGGEDWEIVYSVGEGIGLRSLFFLDENTGYAVGGNGLGVKTTDGGDTWVEMNMGTNTILKSITFTDENNGWCVGSAPILDAEFDNIPSERREVLHTIDGGENWSSFEFTNSPRFFLTDIQMFDNGVGYVSECESAWQFHSRIYKTTDNGVTWNELDLPYYNDGIYDLHFLNENEGWAVGGAYCNEFTCLIGAYILHTSDGGETWEVQMEEISNGNLPQVSRIWEMDVYGDWIIAVGSQTNSGELINAFIGENYENTTNLLEKQDTEIGFYPNPAFDKISFDGLSASNSIKIYNILGVIISERHNVRQDLDISSLKAGMYFIQINTQQIKSFVKY